MGKKLRHAFLIIAHNEPSILKILLDWCRQVGDVYVHIDKKVKGKQYRQLSGIVKSGGGKLVFPRINVVWGDYSQIKTEMLLFETAAQKSYDYYHLLSGVDLPLKPIEEFCKFFEKNKGKEFFNLNQDENNNEQAILKTDKYYLFTSFNSSIVAKKIILHLNLNKFSLYLQNKLHISRCNQDNNKLYKGYNWMSISDRAVRCLLKNKKYIHSRFRFTSCADEIYKQTILMNNGFAESRYETQFIDSSLRMIDWQRGNPYVWRSGDINTLIETPCFFARKFSSYVDKDIVEKISVISKKDIQK